MKHNFTLPITVSLLALAFLDPFRLLMPSSIVWTLLAGLLLATSLYSILFFKEQAADEREINIRAFADRISCLVGMLLLVLTICYRLFTDGHVYPEVILILVTIVITKSAAHWYACRNH